jgi:hypothetical protein
VNANAKPVSESDVAIVDVDVTSSSPLKVTLEPQFKLVSTHGGCRVVHSLLVITALVLLFASVSTPSSDDCTAAGYASCSARHFLAGALFGILYLAYLYECWKCHTRNYLSNISHDAKELAVDIFETCSFKPTTILFRVTCSHQEARKEDSVTVVSYSGDHACTWAECDDHSDFSGLEGWDLAGIQAAIQGLADSSKRPLIEIDSDWCVRSTDGSLEKARQDLLTSNRHRDVDIKVTMPPFAPPTTFKASRSISIRTLPCTISTSAFWFFSVLMLTVPYRIFFETYTGKVKIAFVKTFGGVTPGPAEPMDAPDQASDHDAQAKPKPMTDAQRAAVFVAIGCFVCLFGGGVIWGEVE